MQYKHNLMPTEVFDIFAERYNIIASIEFKKFDLAPDNLREFFSSTKKTTFLPNDRYIIVHHDTDVYINEMPVGLNFRNFFLIADELDIPFFTLIIWTNHFGLQREVDILCRTRHIKDRPMVVESFCTTTHVADCYESVPLNVDAITTQGLCMMGAARSHRYALYNAIQHIDHSRLAMSLHREQS